MLPIMKTIARILTAVALAAVPGACNTAPDTLTPDYIAVKVDKDDDWGFIAPDGEIIMADEFKEKPSAVVNGLFSVKEGDFYTLYSVGDGRRPEAVCEDLAASGYCGEGELIPVVRQRERISVVDRKGETRFVLEPYKGVEITRAQNTFHEGLLLVGDAEGRYGFADTSGEYVIAPKYDGAAYFSEGYAVVYQKRGDDDRYHIIDRNGDQVMSLKKGYEPLSYNVKSGRIPAKNDDGRVIFVSVPDGEEHKCPAKVKYIHEYDDRCYIYFTEDFDCGLMAFADNEQILRPRFSYINFLGDGFLAGNDKGAAIYGRDGEELHDLGDYKWVHNEEPFGLFTLDGDSYIVFDKDGKQRSKVEYADYNSSFYTGAEVLCSEYFDVQAVVNSLIDMINSEGLARYRLGNQASRYLSGNAEDYISTKEESLGDLSVDGYRYAMNVTAYFTENIGQWRYANSDPYDYTKVYGWNPESYLNELCVSIDTEYPLWGSEGNEAVVAGLKAKGFTEVASTHKGADRFLCLLRKGSLYAYVHGDSGETASSVNFAIATPEEENIIIEKINDENED